VRLLALYKLYAIIADKWRVENARTAKECVKRVFLVNYPLG
jgi:hypothetical protein